MVKLSICIAVYNQIELVRRNINTLVQYQGYDIEIVISDDCSTDNIIGLVNEFADIRIKYVKTSQNVGHDLNILNALKNCSSKYAFVLRSRDTVMPEQIGYIIEQIERYPLASYYVFSALDNSDNVKLKFSDIIYKKGMDALQAHTKLFIHPSGNLYNIEYLNISKLEQYIKEYFNDIYGFIVHDLIRMSLAESGDFITSSKYVWMYANTSESKDVAVNSSKNKISVYAPHYEYPRYRCEYFWIRNEISEKHQNFLMSYIVKRFYKSIAYTYKWTNTDIKSQSHYNYRPIKYSRFKERKKFIKYSKELWNSYPTKENFHLERILFVETVKMLFFYPLKYKVLKFIRKWKSFALIEHFVRRI